MRLKRATGLLAAAMLVATAPAAAIPGNGRIAFETGGGVYTLDPDGGSAAALVQGGRFPAFSPDGTRIVFAGPPSGSGGAFTITVADADGSNPVQIGSTLTPRQFVWSPDGTRIAFVAGDYSSGFSIVVLKANGSGSSTVSLDASGDTPPSWSPHGTEIAFATANNTDIAIAKADGSGRRLLIQDATHDMAPSWSPDGSQIGFVRDTYGNFLVYTIRPDGSGLHQLARTPATSTVPPTWSADAARVAFAAREQAGYSRYGPYYRTNVYAVGADGAGERRLTDSWSDDGGSDPSWSPDGRRIVFTSARQRTGGGPQLYVMNSDGSCETQITSGADAVSSPSWQSKPAVAPADPLRCAALSLTGTLGASTDHPALDDTRIYVYHGVIANNGNVASDPLHLFTASTSPFFYVSAAVSGGDCKFTADVSCTLPPLPPGGTARVELRFNVFNTGTFPLEARVDGTQTPDGDLSDNVDDQYRHFPFCAISSQNGSTLRAPGGDDLICGTIGRDRIFSGAGDDRVFGGLGHDLIHGGPGSDQVDGGGGTDFVYGEAGDDKLHGGYGDDVLIGGSGTDVLWGDFGGDYLKGGPGADRFFGGYGNDLIDSRDGLTEHVYCGGGIDRAEADLRDIVSSDCEQVVRRPARAVQARAPR